MPGIPRGSRKGRGGDGSPLLLDARSQSSCFHEVDIYLVADDYSRSILEDLPRLVSRVADKGHAPKWHEATPFDAPCFHPFIGFDRLP